jgi:hypothetical protein
MSGEFLNGIKELPLPPNGILYLAAGDFISSRKFIISIWELIG